MGGIMGHYEPPSDGRTPAYRCAICNINWPRQDAYSRTCPKCEQPTQGVRLKSDNYILMAGEAAQLVADIAVQRAKEVQSTEFEKFYLDRETTKLYLDFHVWERLTPEQFEQWKHTHISTIYGSGH